MSKRNERIKVEPKALLDCPFCGEHATFKPCRGGVRIGCQKRGCIAEVTWGAKWISEQNGIDAWNRRATTKNVTTTILERFKAVKNKTLRKKLIKNYDPGFFTLLFRPQTLVERAEDDCTALSNGFMWRNTTEGEDYWATLYNILFCSDHTFDLAWAKFKPKKNACSIKSYRKGSS
jgi:hypothetical protein